MDVASFSPIIMSLLFLGIFYFLLIRPQQKKNKEIQEMRNNLEIGDNVTTIGGIQGKITKIKDDSLTLEVGADKVRLQIARWAVGAKNSKND